MTSLGHFQLSTISGGTYRADGGTLFGVVPKALWSRRMPADEKNQVPQHTNCLLVQTGVRTILIDTGYCAEAGEPLDRSLSAMDIPFDQIDTVILTHLHFDHAGGATRFDEDGQLQPVFPNAEFVVQRREWVEATAGFPELRRVYPQENLLPLKESGQLRLVDGDTEIVPGIHAIVTGGHTVGHQVLLIENAGESAIYLADLCPTAHHLPTSWGMAYDVDMLQLRRKKPEVLGWVVENDGLALFDHDPEIAAAKLERDKKLGFVVLQPSARL